MKVNYRLIYDLGQQYLNENGYAWSKLYDFICDNGVDSVWNKKFDEFIELFVSYLGSFGMNRKPKGKQLDSKTLKKIFVKGQSKLKTFMKNPSPENHIKCWQYLFEELSKAKLSSSEVMVSKIMMGLNGNSVAFDKNFKHVFLNNPYLAYIGIERLSKELKQYSKGRKKPFETEKGHSIPWPRVLDMAFWKGYQKWDEIEWMTAA